MITGKAFFEDVHLILSCTWDDQRTLGGDNITGMLDM